MSGSGSGSRRRVGRESADPDAARLRDIADAEQSAADLDQTAADLDQTRSDGDQTASDDDRRASAEDQASSNADQASSDRDQRAAERDQAAADADAADDPPGGDAERARDAAGVARATAGDERSATTRDRARRTAARAHVASQRDETARARDLTALARDRAADARDRIAAARDRMVEARAQSLAASESGELEDALALLTGLRLSGARQRLLASADRTSAAADRVRAAEDRGHSAIVRRDAGLDELTGVFRRGTGELALQHEIDRARRSDRPLVLAMIDVDELKHVNDRDGHAAGDVLLRHVAEVITSTLRSYDVVVRWGGDEFVCGLSDMPLEAASRPFEEMRTELRRRRPGGSISVGLAQLTDTDVLESLIVRADAALYQDKANPARRIARPPSARETAVTDPVTGLGNRHALKRDLEHILPSVSNSSELIVATFDLYGFKPYNDTFGHAAGDALLARLSASLKNAMASQGMPYRMGGAEFCVLAQVSARAGEELVRAAEAALSDSGEGWQIGCCWGMAWIPSDAVGAREALRIADERMYAQKVSRASASRQTTAALVQVLVERDTELSAHTSHVAELAIATAQPLDVPEDEVTRIGLAAQLHDIGKTAIPEGTLTKAGPLDDAEWAFMRRHTLIGERIIAAAPALAHTASLVRSTHERPDGTGYPDGLTGANIPLGSRIIAVCDAYDAMTATRPYQGARSSSEAIAELQHCAGTQFDPDIVEAFCANALQHAEA